MDWIKDSFERRSYIIRAISLFILYWVLEFGAQIIASFWLVMHTNGNVSETELTLQLNRYPLVYLVLHLAIIILIIGLAAKVKLCFFESFKIDRRFLLTIVGVFCLVMVVQIIMSMLIAFLYPEQQESLNQQVVVSSLQDMSFLKQLLAFCLLPAIIEEFLTRGLIMRYMLPRYPLIGLFISGLVFASMHSTTLWIHFLLYFLLGTTIGLAYWRTGRIEAAMAVHFLNNVFAIMTIHTL